MIIAVSCVSASGDNETLAAEDQNQVLSDEVNVSSGNFMDLRYAVYDANEGDVISLEGEYVKDEHGLVVENSITLQSKSSRAVIDFNGSYSTAITIKSDATFKDIDFVNSHFDSIELRNASLTLLNCRFIDSGAVRFDGGNLSVINSTFTNSCFSYYGFYGLSHLSIQNSRFYGTEFTNHYFDVLDDVEICDSVFVNSTGDPFNFNAMAFSLANNTVFNLSSAIRIQSEKITISKNTFRDVYCGMDVETDHLAFIANSFENFGRIYLKSNRTEFISSSLVNGSDISFIYSKALNISASNFSNSSIFRVFDCENLSMTGSNFTGNSVIEVFNTLKDCEISGCIIRDAGSRTFDFYAESLTLLNTRFINCSDLIRSCGNLNVSSCDFIESYGFVCGANTQITNCSFLNATGSEYAFIVGDSHDRIFSLTNSTFIDLSCIYINPGHETSVIANCTFRNVGTNQEFLIRPSSRKMLIQDK